MKQLFACVFASLSTAHASQTIDFTLAEQEGIPVEEALDIPSTQTHNEEFRESRPSKPENSDQMSILNPSFEKSDRPWEAYNYNMEDNNSYFHYRQFKTGLCQDTNCLHRNFQLCAGGEVIRYEQEGFVIKDYSGQIFLRTDLAIP